LADRAHEVPSAAGDDVVREAAGGEEAEELDHRRVGRLDVPASERWVLGGSQEVGGLPLELLHADPTVGGEDASSEGPELGVIAGVVRLEHAPEPAVLLLVGGLPRLPVTQLGLVLGHLPQPPQDEVELDRHRLLAPERPVVVEDGDALLGRHACRPVVAGHGRDEGDDRRLGGAVAPAAEGIRVDPFRRRSAQTPIVAVIEPSAIACCSDAWSRSF
jgi:hypothetical protein